MSILATVLPVMIASPSDVLQYRSIARDVLHEWNYIHTNFRRLVLMPVGWDTHSSPELGSPAQEQINERLLKDCDALVGIFWTRLGTPTSSAQSGTVEEIRRHMSLGKPALLYFSNQPVTPSSLDPDQYAALTAFRRSCEPQGLIESFSDEREFREKFRRHLQVALNDNPHLKNIAHEAQRLGVAIAPEGPRTQPRYPTVANSRARAAKVKSRGKRGRQAQSLGIEDLALPDLEPVSMSEVSTKLDLAQAYMDMGDAEGARMLLEEVEAEGSVAQRRTAQRRLKSISD